MVFVSLKGELPMWIVSGLRASALATAAIRSAVRSIFFRISFRALQAVAYSVTGFVIDASRELTEQEEEDAILVPQGRVFLGKVNRRSCSIWPGAPNR